MLHVIFDMDGVISDTQALAAEIESAFMREVGVDHDPAWYTKHYAGISHKQMFHDLLGNQYTPEEILRFEGEIRSRLIARIPDIKPISGIHELLSYLKSKGYLLAVASSSRVVYAHGVLSALQVKEFFKVIITGERVEHGKPAPDIFLLAAKELSALPSECTVIEDAVAGMNAAKAAGMRCIGLVSDNTTAWPADVIVHSLLQIEQEKIL
jgi:beta-phosphoglucomutase